jgi:small subunit ribosomal protein S16
MLKLRLARVGKKKHPIYRLVVSESTKDMYGNHLEILGQYDPHTKANSFNNERISYWMKVGAQASETVYNLLVGTGLITAGKKAKAVSISKKRTVKIDKEKEAEAAKVEAKKAKEEAAKAEAETPAEEAAVETTENTEAAPEENKE